MTDETETAPDEPEKKSSKLMLVLGLVAAIAGGGAGFFAAFSGMILGDDTANAHSDTHHVAVDALPDIAFVPVDPMMVSLGRSSGGQILRFRAELEVPSAYRADVELIMPRIVDVLNSYLRALENGDIASPAALTRLRAQMLRRVQIVAGDGRINDLLIMEFVLT